MTYGQARRILGLLLVALSLVSADRAAQAATGEPQLIRAQSIKGAGEYSNSASLIIDGQMPPQGAEWNGPRCVYWEGAQARFVIAMDGVYRITGLTLQADNNDDYVIEASMEGTTFFPLLVVKGDWGEVFTGMQTLSTLSDDSHFLPEMTIKPVQAKYLRLSARGGDEAYAVSELLIYGSKVQSDSVPPVVVTDGGSTPVTQSGPITPKSIKGYGEFSNAAKLIIDQKIPPEETPWDDPRCVYWTSPQTYFVIDLGSAYWITGLTLQVDLNDEYVVETSMDGQTFTPMVVIDGDWGEIGTGMETLSTIPTDAEFLPEMVLRPARARYVKLSVRSGDDFYAVSELLIYGSKTQPVLAPAPAPSPARRLSRNIDKVLTVDMREPWRPAGATIWHGSCRNISSEA